MKKWKKTFINLLIKKISALNEVYKNFVKSFSRNFSWKWFHEIFVNDWGPPKTCVTLHSPVSKYQHDPSIQLGQSFRNEFFSSFRENSTDEPQIKWIGCQGKYIGIWSCPILEWQTRTSTSTWSFFFVGHTVKTACLIMINKQASINIARKVIEIVTVSLSPQFSFG